MSKIAIVYGSSTGATEAIAEKIKDAFGDADLFNIADASLSDVSDYDFLVLGASTTGVGDLQDDWDASLPDLEKMDLSGKKVALFALGDSASFSTSFASSLMWLYKAVKGKADVVGFVSTDGYTFDDSEGVEGDHFVGLALDEDNEYDKTDERIASWVSGLKNHI